eukprot:gnl/TRDRNA2_/TRDRNA2_176488_c1_seq9.p1 gnl/TRDRNA2_/TRDRNA2_176488_c1~~gnl/TRDRNA2_/TRDRNA2_176488_c1_seq9.p1  ORF type:complete len:258 (-),score=4.91 gnl/TRDRNA2_/TRDRNA2_176488_c1_seq9:183-956(-)
MLKWGDWEYDDVHEILPKGYEIGLDHHNIKTKIEYRRDEKGRILKITNRVRIKTIERKNSISQEERFKSLQFESQTFTEQIDYSTVPIPENIYFECPSSLKKDDLKDFARRNVTETASNLVELLEKKKIERQLKTKEENEQKLMSISVKKKYLPPHLRSIEPSSNTMVQGYGTEELVSLRVGNLSDDTTERDLKNLFGHCGKITRVHLATDNRGVSRGFGFVKFSEREDAEQAKKLLDGYGYANRILRVEFANNRIA